jgi:hypothetical protein
MTLTRREVLGAVGIAAGSCALSSCAIDEMSTVKGRKQKTVHPWRYAKLDPEITAQRAYVNCAKAHCMYGVFSSVMSQLAEKYGEPYRSFPVDMMIYGASGVGGWGSLCGAANGSSALFGLFVEKEDDIKKLVNEMFLWYQQTELPQYVPQKPGLDVRITKSVSNSVLCHASVSRWCRVTGNKAFSKAQKERCRRVTADTARKTVEVLNAHFASRFTPDLQHDDITKSCMSCHTTKGGKVQDGRGKMGCDSCHTFLPGHHI